MNYTTFLLDWDGCMAKTLHVWMNTYMTLYKDAGIITTEDEILKKSWGNLEKGPENFGITDSKAFWQRIIDQVKVNVQTVPLYDGVKNTVIQLRKRGINLAIVTSSERSLVMPPLKYHGLDSLIDFVITPDELKNTKPDPECVEIALNFFRCEKEQAIIIGDTGTDIKTGKNAGISTTLIVHKENSKFTNFQKILLLEPTRVINDFESILTL